jgi:uncharacterized damage-inducible protein DinB
MTSQASIRPFYGMWQQYNERLVGVVRPMTMDQLQIRPAPDLPAIWATVAHTAGVRVYWLCDVLGEPGADSTPFADRTPGAEWEDHPDHPRDAAELVEALESTWRIVDGCLDRWTPEMLEEAFERDYQGQRQLHTRQSVLLRLLTHEAYHCGELSQTLGIHNLPQIDLWGPAV